MAEKGKRRNSKPRASAEVVRAVLYDVQFSGLTLAQIAKKHRLSHASRVSSWVKKYSSQFGPMNTISIPTDQTNLTQEQRLQKELEEARMRIIALETMIDIAEKEFRIAIRKKPGTKQ